MQVSPVALPDKKRFVQQTVAQAITYPRGFVSHPPFPVSDGHSPVQEKAHGANLPDRLHPTKALQNRRRAQPQVRVPAHGGREMMRARYHLTDEMAHLLRVLLPAPHGIANAPHRVVYAYPSRELL